MPDCQTQKLLIIKSEVDAETMANFYIHQVQDKHTTRTGVIIDAILEDLSDRVGIQDSMKEMSAETRSQLIEVWNFIIRKTLNL